MYADGIGALQGKKWAIQKNYRNDVLGKQDSRLLVLSSSKGNGFSLSGNLNVKRLSTCTKAGRWVDMVVRFMEFPI